jgi:hypothetical protein
MKTIPMKATKDRTTARWTPAQTEQFLARLLDSKRLLDAFPGPLPAPCLLRRVPDKGGGEVEAVLLSGTVVVGRKGDSPLCFPEDESLSRRHFRVLVGRNGRCYADDLHSRNGLWINGRRVQYRLLVHGDYIHAGGQDFVFHDGQAADADMEDEE